MARTPAQTAALEKKALGDDNKSEGMRSLFEAGYTVAEVRDTFGTAYGFTYGVATRWAAATGNAVPVAPREPKAEKAPAKAKAPAKPAAKAKAAPAAPPRSKAAIASAARRAAAKAAKA